MSMSSSEEAELSGDEDVDYRASPDEASESYDSDFSESSEPGPSKRRKRDRPPKATSKAEIISSTTESNIPSSEVKKIDGLPIPKSIWDKLKDHQRDGVRWLWKRVGHGQGAILGDEMGLGKTVQVIAILSGLFHDKTLRNVLVVVPATLQKQWVQEFQKWNTAIKVKIYNSGKIKPNYVYISSYEKVRSDASGLLDIDWNMVICDEGHRYMQLYDVKLS
jgi:SNF2 family DNA or RNA helicase